MYVNGDTRIDGSTTVFDVHFTAGDQQSSAYVTANGEASGQIGLIGGLRVANAQTIGIEAGDTNAPPSALVIRGDTAGADLLQAWQTNQNKSPVTAAAFDAQGRLGIGTTTPQASLSVYGTYLQPLRGTITGLANVTQFKGVGTSFQAQLAPGDHVSIPGASPTLYRVISIDPSQQLLTVDTPPIYNFSAGGFIDGPMLSAQDAQGDSLLALDRHGNLAVAGSLTASGVSVTSSAVVGGDATVTGKLTANGLSVGTDASIGGGATISGAVTAQSLSLTEDLTAKSATILANMNVSGSIQSGQGMTVQGKLTVSDSVLASSDLSVTGSLTVNGTSKLAGLAASGPVTMQQTLAVTGASTLTSLALSSTLGVSGASTFNGNLTTVGGWDLWSQSGAGAHFAGHGGAMYMGWLPSIDEAQITFKLSDDSGQIGYAGSSRLDKEAIEPFETDFERVLQLQPRSFVYRGNPHDRRSIGYIAEDLADAGLEELVIRDASGQPRAIRYDRIPLFQLELIRQLRARVEALETCLSTTE
jgi:hypothetical protein